jgi:phosphatidylglycerophosphate synthase/putative flippase GtrA
MIDFTSSISLLTLLGLVLGSYCVRLALAGRARDPRVDREGGGPIVGRGPMEMAYWALGPLGRACHALGVRAAWVTYASLALGVAAGVSIALGHFGLGAALCTASFLGDAIDGMVARLAGTASDRGELLDATVDRYVELLVFGGLAVAVRSSVPLLVLTLLASAGATLVSHATAKAEALGAAAPRGIMRRAERATVLTLALVATPLVARLAPRLADVPLAVALGVVGVFANASAVLRLRAVARGLGAARAPAARRRPLLFLRHQMGAAFATLSDFATMTTLVEVGLTGPVAATGLGAAVGGVVNFVLGRHWVFGETWERPQPQALHYALVSGVSLALNMAGEHVLVGRWHTQYVLARIATALGVAVFWNYPMHRVLVFRTREAS